MATSAAQEDLLEMHILSPVPDVLSWQLSGALQSVFQSALLVALMIDKFKEYLLG